MAADGTLYIETAIDTDGFVAGGKDVEAAAKRMAQTVKGIGASAKIALKKQAEAFVQMNQQYTKQNAKVEELKNKLKELSDVKIETEEYQRLGKELESLGAQYEKSMRFLKKGFRMTPEGINQFEEKLKTINASMKEIRLKQAQMQSDGTAYINPRMSPEYQQIEAKIAAEKQKLVNMNNKLGNSYEALKQKVADYGKKNTKLISISKRLQKAVAIVGTAIKGMGTALKKVGSTIKSMVSALKKAISAMTGFRKETDRGRMSLTKMLGMLLLFSSVFRAISGVTNSIKEGMQNLAQYSEKTNASLSLLMSSLTRLKNSFATAFVPILSVVAPIMSSFIDMLSRGATYVGMFFASLTGQDSFTRAKAVQQDYAASLDKTSKSTKKAAKATKDAAKEAKGSLAPWDELNVIQMDLADSLEDTADVAAPEIGELTPQDMFEEVPIKKSIKGFVEKIKALWNAEDWGGLGKLVADKLNEVVQKIKEAISWDNIGPSVTKFMSGLTEFLNNLIIRLNWGNLGAMIGEGINSLVNSLNLFFEGIDWKTLGVKLAEGVNGLFNAINWENFGALMGNKLMALWNSFYGFVSQLDWEKIGVSIGQAINGAVSKLDLATVGAGISNFIIGVLQAFTSAVQTTDWVIVGQEIANMLMSIDWLGIASGLFDAGVALVSGLLQAFGELPIPVQIAVTAIGTFLTILSGLSIISSLITAINTFDTALRLLTSPIGIAVAAIAGIIAIGGLLIANWDSIKAAAGQLKDWVVGKTKELVDGAVTTFTNLKDKISNILKILSEAISGKIEAIQEFFSGLGEWISGTFVDAWKKAWENVKEVFKNVFDAFIDIVKNPINAVIDIINGLVGAIESAQHWIADALSFSIDIPKALQKLVGMESFGISVGKVELPRLPHLAQGTVVPRRAGEFAAILGDNNREPEVVSPLSTMKQALAEALRESDSLGNNGQPMVINLNLDGQKVISWLVEMDNQARNRSGHGILEGGW